MSQATSNGIDIEKLCEITVRAGSAIMAIYEGPIAVETKDDRSPLTAADRASHNVIVDALPRLDPSIPILSEEGRDISYEERRHWTRLWVVDPLDGTKEFIKRNGEFTVNIALVEGAEPVLGVVYVPAQDVLFLGQKGRGAWRRASSGESRPISVRVADERRGLTVVQSRSHPSPELEEFLRDLPVAESLSVGSSLKLCAVAEGRADLYPRLGPTMEWDTAAGQAVVEAAGGKVLDREGRPLRYNKENLLNPHFVVYGGMGSEPRSADQGD